MDILLTILTIAFIALLLGFAITFGFTLLIIIMMTGGLVALLAVAEEAWRRWRFVRHATDERPSVIETDYEDISDKK